MATRDIRNFLENLNTPIKIGNATGDTKFAPDGTVTAEGDATYFDDVRVTPNIESPSSRCYWQGLNGCIKFSDGAIFNYDGESIDNAIVSLEIPHGAKLGAGTFIYPHIHWIQREATMPNWLFTYKKMRNGEAFTIRYNYHEHTMLKPLANKFTYTSGHLLQMTTFAPIDISDCNISDIIAGNIWRDTTNSSGLFAGADTVVSSTYLTAFAHHVEFIADGSQTEWSQ